MSGAFRAQSDSAAPASSPRLDFDPFVEASDLWESHGWDGAQEMAAAMSVIRVQQIVVSRLNAALKPAQLSFARFEILVLLHFSRDGTMPLGKIGDRLSVHPASITATVDRLTQDGLVTRTPSETDRRTVVASITREGRAVVVKMAPIVGSIRMGLDELGEAGSKRLTALLTDVRRAAGDFGDP